MRQPRANDRQVLEIGYQRNYNPMYQAAYDGHHQDAARSATSTTSRLAWHRNGNWRRQGEPPSPDYDPSKWGYPTFEHSGTGGSTGATRGGCSPSSASHQVNVANWFSRSLDRPRRRGRRRLAHNVIGSTMQRPRGVGWRWRWLRPRFFNLWATQK